jgi:hypothetical protein
MKLRNAVRLSPVAAEAFWWLTLAWVLLDVLPGTLYLKIMPPKRVPGPPEPVSATPLDPRIRTVAGVVGQVANLMPVRSVCFHRAIAVDRMLRRRGIPSVMHYGVLRDSGALKAHVWVTSAGVGVVGLTAAEPYTEIAQFVDVDKSTHSAVPTPRSRAI